MKQKSHRVEFRQPLQSVTAIFPLEDVPENWKDYTERNADWFKMSADQFQAKWNAAGKTS